ncbi:MAG: hypothetical protein DWQ40_11905 [Actinobacteria bacterium]|nr:MAG: hypothetical protein DWQ40_11905 [Actinomycetota bacterium]REK35752.1 MAG: hypothetical protein DWQ20_05875 [Actinomycetota bacterium]
MTPNEPTVLVDSELLAIYLNDHWAGAAAGGALARRLWRQNASSDWGDRLRRLAEEIKEDDQTLARLRSHFSVDGGRAKRVFARASEIGSRLKPNGRMFGYSPLSRLLEAEAMLSGVAGKQRLWSACRHGLPPGSAPAFDFETLERRAGQQLELLREFHHHAAGLAFNNRAGARA